MWLKLICINLLFSFISSKFDIDFPVPKRLTNNELVPSVGIFFCYCEPPLFGLTLAAYTPYFLGSRADRIYRLARMKLRAYRDCTKAKDKRLWQPNVRRRLFNWRYSRSPKKAKLKHHFRFSNLVLPDICTSSPPACSRAWLPGRGTFRIVTGSDASSGRMRTINFPTPI